MKYGKDEINENDIYAIANSVRIYLNKAEDTAIKNAKEKFERQGVKKTNRSN